jgi:hypothetical protein
VTQYAFEAAIAEQIKKWFVVHGDNQLQVVAAEGEEL